jgi:hypothetical protein
MSAVYRVVLAILTASLTAGCFPWVTSYLYLDAEGVTHPRGRCGNVAPPAAATYERSGVRFDVTLEARTLAISKAGLLRVRAPQDTKVSIPKPRAHISMENGSLRTFELQPRGHPPENRSAVESLARMGLRDHYFYFVDVPEFSSPGRLTLPAVYLDGVEVIAPVFTFERRPHAAFVPLNC